MNSMSGQDWAWYVDTFDNGEKPWRCVGCQCIFVGTPYRFVPDAYYRVPAGESTPQPWPIATAQACEPCAEALQVLEAMR